MDWTDVLVLFFRRVRLAIEFQKQVIFVGLFSWRCLILLSRVDYNGGVFTIFAS